MSNELIGGIEAREIDNLYLLHNCDVRSFARALFAAAADKAVPVCRVMAANGRVFSLAAQETDLQDGFYDVFSAPVAPASSAQQDATAPRFNCFSSSEGNSWYDNPADEQILEDVFGVVEINVGDEYEIQAGWRSVTARYRVTEVLSDGEIEVECVSHSIENSHTQPTEGEVQHPTNATEAALMVYIGQAYLDKHNGAKPA